MIPLRFYESDEPSGKREKPLLRGSMVLLGREEKKGPQREITCFQCGSINRVPQLATSSQCKDCGSYIQLDDIVLKPGTRRKFVQTHGNVIVQSQSILEGMWIRCKNLHVHGLVKGHIEAEGVLIFEKSCKFDELIKAGELRVPRGVQLEFHRGAICQTMRVEGEVLGMRLEMQEIWLGKNAVVLADVVAKSMNKEPGAVFRGHFHRPNSFNPER